MDDCFNNVNTGDAHGTPYSTIDAIKRRAKSIRKRLDPNKTIPLDVLQSAVARCLGRDHHHVFSGREPANPVFPSNLPAIEWPDFQRRREISVLSALLPNVSGVLIAAFVSWWGLVRWTNTPLESPAPPCFTSDSSTNSRIADSRNQRYGFTASTEVPELTKEERDMFERMRFPNPPDQFMPPTVDFASQRAIALASIEKSMPLRIAYHVTAVAFGFGNWAELEASFKLSARSRFDEELPEDDILLRWVWQIYALQSHLGVTDLLAMQLHNKWRPTSQSLAPPARAASQADALGSSSPTTTVRYRRRLSLQPGTL